MDIERIFRLYEDGTISQYAPRHKYFVVNSLPRSNMSMQEIEAHLKEKYPNDIITIIVGEE